MRTATFAFIIGLAPSIAVGQQAATSGQVSASASATATTPKSQTAVNGNAQASTTSSTSADVPSNFSAENRAKLDATFSAARQRNLPQQPIRDRIAEGQAKGATEAHFVDDAPNTET